MIVEAFTFDKLKVVEIIARLVYKLKMFHHHISALTSVYLSLQPYQ